MEVGGWGGWKDLEGEETVNRIYCMKNSFSIKMNEKKKNLQPLEPPRRSHGRVMQSPGSQMWREHRGLLRDQARLFQERGREESAQQGATCAKAGWQEDLWIVTSPVDHSKDDCHSPLHLKTPWKPSALEFPAAPLSV